MLQLEDALNDLVARIPFHAHEAILTNDGLLIREVAQTLENQIARGAGYLHFLAQRRHVATDLLQVRARHMDDTRECQTRDLDILHIRVKKLEEVVLCRLLLGVLHCNAELVRVLGRQIKCQGLRVLQRLDQLEEIHHIDAENLLHGAVIVLKTVGVQTEVDEDCMALVHSDDLETG